jgi:hypothetical protein
MYWDVKGNIFKTLKSSLQESVGLAPIIILMILFWSLKIFPICEEFPQNIPPSQEVLKNNILFIPEDRNRDSSC